MKRIFIALKIDQGDQLIKMLSTFRSEMKDEKIKWTGAGNLHVTIAFIGDTADDRVRVIGNMLKRVCDGSGEFALTLKGAGVFRSLKDPKVIWTGIEPSVRLQSLYEIIRTGLAESGIILEERRFRPHLTLGRVRNISDIDRLGSLLDRYNNGNPIQVQEIREIILYESLLYPAGPVYKPLGKYPVVREHE